MQVGKFTIRYQEKINYDNYHNKVTPVLVEMYLVHRLRVACLTDTELLEAYVASKCIVAYV